MTNIERWIIRREKENEERKSARIPPLEYTPALIKLFDTPGLWEEVNGIPLIRDTVALSLLRRVDGIPPTERVFSVFVADRKRKIEKLWGVVPIAAGTKSHLQMWDKPFVICFIANIQMANQDSRGNVNKIAYTIAEDVPVEDLLAARAFRSRIEVFRPRGAE